MRICTTVAFLGLLAACNGGGGSSGPTPTAQLEGTTWKGFWTSTANPGNLGAVEINWGTQQSDPTNSARDIIEGVMRMTRSPCFLIFAVTATITGNFIQSSGGFAPVTFQTTIMNGRTAIGTYRVVAPGACLGDIGTVDLSRTFPLRRETRTLFWEDGDLVLDATVRHW